MHQVHVAKYLVMISSDDAHADGVKGKLVKLLLLVSDFCVIGDRLTESVSSIELRSEVFQLFPVLLSELGVLELDSTVKELLFNLGKS